MKYVALLRGINIGRAKRIAMADLRALFEKLGFSEVRTLLNSGNVVFSLPSRPSATLPAIIEQSIADRLRVTSRVTVVSAREMDEIVAGNPLLDVADNHSRLMVSVMATAGHRERLKPLLGRDWGTERVELGKRVVYLWCPEGVADSEVAAAIAKALGDAVTTRNWATVTKLQALLRPGQS